MTTVVPTQVSVGRQPIYDADRNVVAYEVLYRGTDAAATADFEDGDAATARVLVNILTEIELEQSCGHKPLFLNCTRYFLETQPILPPERCVLEVLETVNIDDGVVKAIELQRKRGYKIALDDFLYSNQWDPLLEMADYVKIDLRQHTPDSLSQAVKNLPGFTGTLLAEKVESEQEFDVCRELGFKLFQGYYLRKPETVLGHAPPNNLVALMSLTQQLMNKDANATDIANSIRGDVTLSYRLLRLANSAMTGIRTHIGSIQQAVTIAGTDLLARWVALLGLARIENSPTGYFEIALQRARMCELISQTEHVGNPAEAYILGLFSILDAMIGSPWQELARSLPLNEQIAEALANRKGDLGRLLNAVESYEAHPDPAAQPYGSLPQAFWEGAAYAQEMTRSLKSLAKTNH